MELSSYSTRLDLLASTVEIVGWIYKYIFSKLQNYIQALKKIRGHKSHMNYKIENFIAVLFL